MERENYGRILGGIDSFLCSIFRVKSYPTDMSPVKAAPKQSVATTTSGGITVVNTEVLLRNVSVLKAIKTLGNKATQPTPKK